ncbi:argininosuccinate lyase [Mangrovicoccus sp. HB161399]|uniref:argininosuccinate lyase n=1 Tax=Mangrovicoccus sp. HB161399 TaxID=2720392 RepID=UPI0015518B4C|nr:argininosuccinate lyase [Mangrovicoccus sp. HB161399]
MTLPETKMPSKVSGLLSEPLAPEILAGVNAPLLARSFAASLPGFAAINRAHLVMLAECGLVPADLAGRLLRHVGELEAEGPDAFELDPEREDAWFNYEAELARRAGSEAGHLHMARSRNDLKATLDRLRQRDLGERLLAAVLDLREVLAARGGAEAAAVMPGYTHLQHAQPVTFGWYLLGIEAALGRDSGRIADALARMDDCPLGAGALAGTRFAIDRGRTADLLGFSGPQSHALDAIASRDGLIELGNAAAQLSLTLARMAQDFYLWSTHEFGMLRFPDRVAITSSIMPQKKNLAVLEHLKSRPAALSGALSTACAASRAVPFGHSQEVGVEAGRWLWDALEDLVQILPAARVVAEAAMPDRDRMKALAGANFATATALADALCTECAMPFREAHHVAGRFVRLSLEGMDSRQALEAASREIAGRPAGLPPERLADVLDPAGILDAPGCGPSLAETARLQDRAMAALAADRTAAEQRAARRLAAGAALAACCGALMDAAAAEASA